MTFSKRTPPSKASPLLLKARAAQASWDRPYQRFDEHDLQQRALVDYTVEEQRTILAHARLVTIPEGWVPIKAHTAPDRVYVVLDGSLRVIKNGETVAHLGQGDVAGEMSFAHGKLRNASVIADSDAVVLHFTAEDWASVTAQVPKLANKVQQLVAERSS